MKFSAWQMIVALALMFAAIITAQVVAPGVGPTIVGMCTSLIALFIEREKGSKS